MTYIDRDLLNDYPYLGTFYRIADNNDSDLPLDEQTDETIIVFETKCDITESSHSWSRNFIWAKYAIYFPFDSENEELKIKLGDLFESNINGLFVNGKVVGVFPTQLNGVTVYVQDTDV